MPQSEPADARMRACGVAEVSGQVQSLRLPRPQSPGPGEILLDVLAAGVGAWDQLLASSEWDVGLRLPAALGVEGAGRVVAVGPDVTAPAVGDLVLAHSAPLPGHSGLWAEQVLLRAADAAPLPEGLDPARAAALPINGLTACQALDWLDLSSGMRLLVTNGAGVTGALVLQLAVAAGVHVTATASPAPLTGCAAWARQTSSTTAAPTGRARSVASSTRRSPRLPERPPPPGNSSARAVGCAPSPRMPRPRPLN
ncbi:alcohol dehydrogenase catalytic domain-containing protein [Streptomyces indonesiensis]